MNESGTKTVRGARAIDPVAVELYDDDNVPALYIDDGSPTPALHMALHNQSGRALEFDAAASHHVELLFRPGVLSQRAQTTLASQDAAKDVLSGAAQAWGLSLASADAGMPVSLQLRYRGDDRRFESDARMILSLHGLSAAGAQGARPTQVQVTVQGVRFDADPPFATTRHRHLNLLHWGRAGLPLHAGFPGSAVLVNDGATHEPLVLRVVNTSLDETLRVAPDAKDQAVFDLYFDMGDEDRWWTLEAQVPHIQVSWDGTHFEDVKEATGHQGPAQRWEIKPPASGLAPGQHFDIQIANLRTRRLGSTNMYLDVHNLLGYRPSNLVCTINRAPLTEQGVKALADGVTALTARVAALENRASLTEQGVTALTTRVTALENRTLETEQGFKALKERLDKVVGPADEKSFTKLERDVKKLKAETHIADIPPTFPPGCAYAQPKPGYPPVRCSMVGNEVTYMVKFTGFLAIPNVSEALQKGDRGAVVVPIPIEFGLKGNECELHTLIVHGKTPPFKATFRTKTVSRASPSSGYVVQLYLTSVEGNVPDGENLAPMGEANLSFYDW
jgi:hypothetical protein